MFDSFAVFFLRKHFSFDFVSHFSSPAKSHLPFTLITSEREPPQVFMLLEGLYNAFDKIARRLKVFKVETIGDCYVGAYVSHAHYHAYQSVLLSNVINLTFLAHMIAPPFFFSTICFFEQTAATGLPEPRKDHAVAMCRFANECLSCMKNTVFALEIKLGPGTSDLAMRFGIHSGRSRSAFISFCFLLIGFSCLRVVWLRLSTF